jgi:hypothetical protein
LGRLYEFFFWRRLGSLCQILGIYNVGAESSLKWFVLRDSRVGNWPQTLDGTHSAKHEWAQNDECATKPQTGCL